MSQVTLVPAPEITYPVDIMFPPQQVDFTGSIPEVTQPNIFWYAQISSHPVRGGNNNPAEISAGQSNTGVGQTGYDVLGGGAHGVLGRRCNHSVGNTAWYHMFQPAMMPLEAGIMGGGAALPEWQRVNIISFYASWGAGTGIEASLNTGMYLMAYRGAQDLTTDMAPGGPSPNRAMCGIVGRNALGVQQFRFVTFDAAGAVLTDTPLSVDDAEAVNRFDFVLQAATSTVNARLFVHVNNVTQAAVEQEWDGVDLLFPSAFTGATAPYGYAWGVIARGAVGPATVNPVYAWRLRGGRFLPDGTPVG